MEQKDAIRHTPGQSGVLEPAGLGRSWRRGGTCNPQWPAAVTREPFPAAAGARAHPPPPTCAFPAPEGFKSRAVSLESAAQGFPKHTWLLFQRTTSSFSDTHSLLGTKRSRPAAGSQAGTFPASVRPRKSPLVSRPGDPVPPPSITPDRKDPEPPTHLVPGPEARRAAGSPAVFHFQFAPCLSWGEDSERRFGKGRDNSPRAQAQRSLIQVFADAQLSIQSAGVPGSIGPSPPSRVTTLLESSWEAPEILLSHGTPSASQTLLGLKRIQSPIQEN